MPMQQDLLWMIGLALISAILFVGWRAYSKARSLPRASAAPLPVAKPVVDAALQAGLHKTRTSLMGRLQALLGRDTPIDAGVLANLEELMLTADMGVGLTNRLLDALQQQLQAQSLTSPEAIYQTLRQSLADTLVKVPQQNHTSDDAWALPAVRPWVVLLVGVNGAGKTTTLGKLASHWVAEGKQVLLAAGDTFRAAAKEQLGLWGDKSGARLFAGEDGADPAGVLFGAVQHAAATGVDIVLADTAGRLHTKTELMDEVKKIKRAMGKAREGAPDEIWLVVDGTSGQNALHQAREFHAALGLTGIILTKLDGTAKGGVVVAICEALQLPIRFVGIGEKPEDLRPFDAYSYVTSLFETP